jgi:hypothetical protein
MEYLLFIIVLLVVALVLLQYWLKRARSGRWTAADRKFFVDNWRRITANEDLRHRVMDADKLLEHFMRRRGWQGSFGEMLKRNGPKFTDLNGLWRAHKLRNGLAHQLNLSLGAGEAEQAIRAFRRALKDLGL